MATHAQNIANLRNAVYGEQVRGSMIELFEEDYALVKDGVMLGTDISSSADPTTGYVDGAVYINTNTWHVFKLEGTAWADHGVIKGDTGASVTNAVDNGDGTFYLTFSDGSISSNIATIQGIQGPQGPQGPTGATGPAGRSVTSITMSGTGKSHPVTATYSDGSTETVGVVQDGADGSGTGDMSKATYDPNDHGYVDAAAGVTNGTNTLTYATLDGKADAATSLGGYGITDAYTKTEVDAGFVKKPAASVTANKVLTSDGSSGATWEEPDGTPTSGSNKTIKSGAVYTALANKADKTVVDRILSRSPRDITSDIQADNGASLFQAISEQNLEKYGYKIGDYFKSPSNRTLTEETYSSGTVTQTDKSVKIKYTLADMDTYYGGYNSYAVVNTHHVGVVVDSGVNRQWAAAALTSGGYESSKLHTFLKGTTHTTKNYALMYAIQQDFTALFGGYSSHLLANNKLFETYSGTAFSWAWADTAPAQSQLITALTEAEVYGFSIWGGDDVVTDRYHLGEAVKHLELFRRYRFNQILGDENAHMWLRGLATASAACFAFGAGLAGINDVSGAGRAVGLILLH